MNVASLLEAATEKRRDVPQILLNEVAFGILSALPRERDTGIVTRALLPPIGTTPTHNERDEATLKGPGSA